MIIRGRAVPVLAAAMLAGAALAACAGSDPGTAAGSAGPAGTVSAPGSSGPPPAGTFRNPVQASNFPDPGVLKAGATWYAYGTNGPGGTVPLLSSPDLVHWSERGDAMPQVGAWATSGSTWAPEVLAVGRTYVLYYVARATAPGKQCIGVAESTAPAGPFTDRRSAPLVCEAAEGGSIDPNPFRDADGSLWLYWKNDGNCCGQPVHLYGRRLAADGLSFRGARSTLLTNTKPWQGNLVEAPEMVRHGTDHVLFYSANGFDTDRYAVGYALCRSAAGPCTDGPGPILRSNDAAAGPGHCYVVTDAAGQDWMLYHAWNPDQIGSTDPGRQLWLDRLDWPGGKPVVHGPTADPQPAP
jgi:beta-xylosidase